MFIFQWNLVVYSDHLVLPNLQFLKQLWNEVIIQDDLLCWVDGRMVGTQQMWHLFYHIWVSLEPFWALQVAYSSSLGLYRTPLCGVSDAVAWFVGYWFTLNNKSALLSTFYAPLKKPLCCGIQKLTLNVWAGTPNDLCSAFNLLHNSKFGKDLSLVLVYCLFCYVVAQQHKRRKAWKH